VVDDSQLSLAIGKKGQNVRLAAKLLGWKIDIKSEEEKRQEVEEQMRGVLNVTTTPLESVPDLEPNIIEKLVAAGITTVEAVADMTPEQLEEVPGIGPKTVEKISIAVNNYFSSLDAAEAADSGEPALADAEEVAGEEVALADEEAAEAGEASPEESEAAKEVAEEDAELADEEASLVAAEAEGAGDDEESSGDEEGPDSAGQSGDIEGLPDEADADSESVEELVEEGQYYEAEVVDGVENAPLADEREVTIHERPATEGENVPDEEEPGEKR
jgi:N utilization substance protein A